MSVIARALLSVSDKTGVTDFARELAARKVELLSTGGTAAALREAGLPVTEVSDFTGFPEMLDGRVKTLHPKIHAGLLARRDQKDHMEQLSEQGFVPIDLVCVNLYPFEATVAADNVPLEAAIEQIDIGGPSLLRAAAKNFGAVAAVCDPADYGRIIAEMDANGGAVSQSLRLELAQKVFAHTAQYDAVVAWHLADQLPNAPETRPFVIACSNGEALRYGENPHQAAVLYREPVVAEACIAHAELLHGKEMSFNNYVDGHAALEAVKELCGRPGAAIVKHTNPCGFATGMTLAAALEAAWAGDPVSAFGSVIAVTEPVDLLAAQTLEGRFVEALIAPSFDAEALDYLMQKSKDIRLLQLREPLHSAGPGHEVKQIGGGWLVQERDTELAVSWNIPTEIVFPESKRKLALFGMMACKHVKSNAIVIVREYEKGHYALLGMGAGQPNRVDAVRKLAITKAMENVRLLYKGAGQYGLTPMQFAANVMAESVLVSDAFFPFADNVDHAAEAGIHFIVQPGGSKRDEEVISACDRYGIAMAFTGTRHFKH
ncbi:MAG: bifunctional phosphoribosylaminoimidazolecarboxamide formyltransferase/IMP cyclohydrolase [Kiritimatiellia bacterium]